MNTGTRLREERERLGYSQSVFGEIGGVKKLAQINYEKGERYPDAAYLSKVAEAGADVAYILTGHRSQAAPPPAPEVTLNRKERAFWDMYKELSAEDQREIYQDIKEKKRIADMEKRLREYEGSETPIKKLG